MIYTVELNYSDELTADEWKAWYETYLKQLVLLDGIETAQRFQAVNKLTVSYTHLTLPTKA